MAESSAEGLDALQRLVEQAKAVPMSASCMINRADALALVAGVRTALAAELDAARAAAEASPPVLERAKEQAAEVVRAAEHKAEQLVRASEVLQAAQRRATDLQERAGSEAESLRKEADVYVDSRIAAMEAGLQKTLSQIQTMRARLASRSGLDADA
jgi:cell division septum initiation protein DivIVA